MRRSQPLFSLSATVTRVIVQPYRLSMLSWYN